MERRHAMTARSVLVLRTVLTLGAVTSPERAAGQEPVLEMDAACRPPAVRPNEDALLWLAVRRR
ncbi:MAG TPA: hypothetical protein VIO14_08825 [Dehalococcoidia bacterium]